MTSTSAGPGQQRPLAVERRTARGPGSTRHELRQLDLRFVDDADQCLGLGQRTGERRQLLPTDREERPLARGRGDSRRPRRGRRPSASPRRRAARPNRALEPEQRDAGASRRQLRRWRRSRRRTGGWRRRPRSTSFSPGSAASPSTPPKPPIRTSPTGSRGRDDPSGERGLELDAGVLSAGPRARAPRRSRRGPGRSSLATVPEEHRQLRPARRRVRQAEQSASTSRCSVTRSPSRSSRASRRSAKTTSEAATGSGRPRRRPRRGTPAGTRRSPGCRATWSRRRCPCADPAGELRRRPRPSNRPWWISYPVTGWPSPVPVGSRSTLSAPKTGPRVDQAEAVGRRAGRRPRCRRVARSGAEHLGAAADPEHRATGARVLEDRGVEPAGAQPGQVGDGRAGPGQHHQVGADQVARRGGEEDVEVGLEPERVDVGEVADPRQPDDRDPEHAVAVCAPGDRRGRGRPRSRARAPGATAAPRTSAVRSAGSARRCPGASSDRSPRNLLATNPAISAWSAGSSSATVPNSAANSPPRSMSPTTTVGRSGVPGQAHVHVVAGAQVDLGRAAGALGDDHVVPAGQVVVRRVRRLGEVPAPALPVGRGDRAAGPAHHHDVAAGVTTGLEQDRVHRGLGLGARGARLDPLGPADLALPSAQTIELFDMFCALYGATLIPRRCNARHSPVVTMLLPASEVVPAISSPAHASASGSRVRPRGRRALDGVLAPADPDEEREARRRPTTRRRTGSCAAR